MKKGLGITEGKHTFHSNGQGNIVLTSLTHPDIDVNKSCRFFQTPLTAAAQNGYLDCMVALLAAPGIDINLVGADGRTPLYYARLYHQKMIEELLLEAGAVSGDTEST